MNVCILGFDALEYSAARDHPDLCQKECHKLRNDIDIKNPSTPQLWASLTTGKLPKEHGITGTWFSKKRLKVKTWFDLVPGSIGIQVPCHNITEKPQGEMTRAMGKPAAMRRFAKKCWKRLNKRRSLTLETLTKKRPPLLMTHFYCTDFIQHMYAWSKDRMEILYDWCAETTRLVREENEDGAVLVVSDHGMVVRKRGRIVVPGQPKCRRGYHTNYAFFSSNIPVGLQKNAHITDIFQIVLDLVDMPSPKETTKLKEVLEALGYVDEN